MRNRGKLSQVVQAGFEHGRIAVTKRFEVATADQHGRKTLAAAKLKKLQPHKKDAERRDKKRVRTGKNTSAGQAV